MRPVRVAVAGSVDDGKSTLLGRLMSDSGRVFTDEVEAVRKASGDRADAALNLAFFTDGLQLERRDGITLDVAWRHLTLGARRLLLADVPGHAELVRNMATGASTADAALLLVDAERGVQPQTRRHLVMLSGLGVRRVVVCINKMDAVGFAQSVARASTEPLQSLAEALGITLEVIPVSAIDGDNVVRRSERMPWYAGPTVAARLEAMEPVPVAPVLRAVVQLGSDEGGWTALHVLSGELRAGEWLTAWTGVSPHPDPLPRGGEGERERCRVLELSPHGLGRVRLEPPQARGTLLCLPQQPPRVAAVARLIVTWLGPSDCVTVLQHGRRTPARLRGPFARVAEIPAPSPFCPSGVEGLLERGEFAERRTPLDSARGDREPVSINPLRPGDVAHARLELESPTWFDRWEDSAGTGTCLLLDAAGRTVAGGRFT